MHRYFIGYTSAKGISQMETEVNQPLKTWADIQGLQEFFRRQRRDPSFAIVSVFPLSA